MDRNTEHTTERNTEHSTNDKGIEVFDSNIFSISRLFVATIPRSLPIITEALRQITTNRLKNPNYSAIINLKDTYYEANPQRPLSYFVTEATIKKVNKPSPRRSDVITTIDDLLNVTSSDPSGNLLKKLILLLTFHSRNQTDVNIDGLLWKGGKLSVVSFT